MKIYPIEQSCLPSAKTLLVRGFPDRPPEVWQKGIERLSAHHRKHGFGPIGYLLNSENRDVGVILTIEGRPHLEDGNTFSRINLSSWYVDEDYRWMAARMLQKITSKETITYTDLTPSISVQAINERLGFQLKSDGLVLLPLLIMAILPSKARVVSFTDIEPGSLTEAEQRLLADHADLGAPAIVLETAEGYMPVIVVPTWVKGVPGVRVIYAMKPSLLVKHIGAVARFLIRSGWWFIEMEANQCKLAPFGIRRRGQNSSYVKTAMRTDWIDHTYSELVFLEL